MIYLNKILPLLFSPLIVVTALIAFGALRKKPIWIGTGLLVLWVASTPLIANTLFRWIEGGAIARDPATLPQSEAVVVLSGMLKYVDSEIGRESADRPGIATEWGESADRFFGGLEVWQAGKAEHLIFTGSLLPWQREVEPEDQYLARLAIGQGVNPEQIRVTRNVVNTEQEAVAIRAMLIPDRGNPPERRSAATQAVSAAAPQIILVTSAFHMPRAQLIFEEAGLRVIPYPVDFRVSAEGRDPTDYFPDPKALDRTDMAIRELLGRSLYRLKYAF